MNDNEWKTVSIQKRENKAGRVVLECTAARVWWPWSEQEEEAKKEVMCPMGQHPVSQTLLHMLHKLWTEKEHQLSPPFANLSDGKMNMPDLTMWTPQPFVWTQTLTLIIKTKNNKKQQKTTTTKQKNNKQTKLSLHPHSVVTSVSRHTSPLCLLLSFHLE